MIEILSPEELKKLIQNNSRYAMAKATGIRETTLSNYANGVTDVIRMSLENAIKLTEYQKELLNK
ncbi:XRE family transcriptional regulator [Aerococcaceae bacterium NML180378]|nr:XRE family transcriptional regulator [Aerococcaceae bacterium NML180378]